MVRRIGSHQDSCTGGQRQPAGSVNSPVWVGMTRVPEGPIAASRARITATGPPATQPPNAFMEEWASRVMPGRTPSRARSSRSVSAVNNAP
ncbi:hypothetical protein D3C75_1152140 [compost metagenome]